MTSTSTMVEDIAIERPETFLGLLPRQSFDENICRSNELIEQLKRELAVEVGLRGLVGVSPAFKRVLSEIKILAKSEATVLITGDTGTGKDLCARAIHYTSPRASKPFIPVSCGAIPEDLFENALFGHERGSYTDAQSRSRGLIHEAEGGTLFLDDIESLSPKNQAKLLGFLDTHAYLPLGAQKQVASDVRVISASNQELLEKVKEKAYRGDLFFRLAVLTLNLPPLHQRAEDILPIAISLLRKYSARYGKSVRAFSPVVEAKLCAYSWPGNVRELENVVHRAVLYATGECVEDIALIGDGRAILPSTSMSSANFNSLKKELIANFEREYLTRMLEDCNGNISEAARRAGKDRRAFWELIKKHRIICAAK